MTDNLKRKAVGSVFWRTIDQFGKTGIQFVVSVLIARALAPSDFGLMGIMLIFVALSQVFVNSGFGAALIREPTPKQQDYTSVFFFNLSVSILLYLLLVLTSSQIAAFFNQPLLEIAVKVMSIVIIFNALAMVHGNYLAKNLQFKKLAIVSTCSSLLAGIVGIGLAHHGYGVWSLVAKTLTYGALHTLGLWSFSGWRPTTRFSFQPIKKFFPYSSRLLVSSLLDAGFQNLLTLLIGKYYSLTDLGNYTKANRIQEVPSTTLTAVIGQVSFPVLSIIQSDDKRLRSAYRRILRITVFAVFPTMIMLAAVADNLIVVLLTEKWRGAVIYLQIMSFAGMLYPLHAITLNISKVKGRSDIFLNLEVVKKVVLLVAIVFAVPHGVVAMVVATTVCSYALYAVNGHFNGRLISYSVFDQLRDILPILAIAILAGLSAFLAGFLPGSSSLILGAQVVAGAGTYSILAAVFCRDQILEIKGMLNDMTRRN